MKYTSLLFIGLLISGCQSLPDNYKTVGKATRKANCPDYSEVDRGYYGGDGSSSEQAIEIVGFNLSFRGWLRTNYPGSKIILQELILSSEHHMKYDLFTVEIADGSKKSFWVWLTGGGQCR